MNVKLKYPIKVEATPDRPEYEIKELNLADRMTVEHAEKIPDDAFQGGGVNPARFLPAVASMSGIALPILKKLDYADLVNIVGSVMTPFLSDTESQKEK